MDWITNTSELVLRILEMHSDPIYVIYKSKISQAITVVSWKSLSPEIKLSQSHTGLVISGLSQPLGLEITSVILCRISSYRLVIKDSKSASWAQT